MYSLDNVDRFEISFGNRFKLDFLTMKFEVEYDALNNLWNNQKEEKDIALNLNNIDADDIKKVFNNRFNESQWKILYKFGQDSDFVEADSKD